MSRANVRLATVADIPLICEFVRKLADYEQLLHEVVFQDEQYVQCLFTNPPQPHPEVLIAECDDSAVGFALFIQLTHGVIHLEDLFVSPTCRGKGAGIALLSTLAREATARGVTDIRWNCLDWNKPSITFYESLGARVIPGQIMYRLQGKLLAQSPKGSVMIPMNGVVERTPSSCSYRLLHESTPLVTVSTSLSFTTFLATPVLLVIDIVVARAGSEAFLIPIIEKLRGEALQLGYSRVDVLLNTELHPNLPSLLQAEFEFVVMPEWIPFRLRGDAIPALAARQ